MLHGGSQQQGELLRNIQAYLNVEKERRIASKEIYDLKEQLKTLQQKEEVIKEKSSRKEQLESTLYYLNHQAAHESSMASLQEQLNLLKLNCTDLAKELEQ